MDVFTAVADPNRRALLDAVAAAGEQTAGELGAALPGLTQPAVSHHLRLLREAGLLTVRADGQRRLYRLAPEGLQPLHLWAARYRRFWSAHLDALQRYLDDRQGG
jgi:DNA-binding transcriptional ArsR family regulator